MKALTLWQPWASFMLCGPLRPKRNETRPWRTHYRGPLAIHAAKKEPAWVRRQFCESGRLRNLLWEHLRDFEDKDWGAEYPEELFAQLPRGEVVGRVELIDCFQASEYTPTPAESCLGDYSDGRFVFPTRNARRLVTPIPYRGRQGLWNLPDEVLDRTEWVSS